MAEAEGALAPDTLASLTYSQLRGKLIDIAGDMAEMKAKATTVQAEIDRRLASAAAAAFVQADKQYGTVNLPLQDGLVAKAVVDKKVEWDSEKLLGIAQSMPWERVRAVFKIAFSVPETNYKGIAAVDPELCKRIDEARTTRYGTPKITIEEAK